MSQLAYVDVFLLLRRDDGQLLFGQRGPRVYSPLQWNFVSGKADVGEDVATAIIREAAEEAGVTVVHDDLQPLGVVHYLTPEATTRVGFVFFTAYEPDRHGPIVNCEPDKCLQWRWAPAEQPPQPFEPYNAAVMSLLQPRARPLVLLGWPQQHRMRLRPDLLAYVAAGSKTVEVRLLDPKRQQLRVGDMVTFEPAGPTPADALTSITVEVTRLSRYPSFAALTELEDVSAVAGRPASRAEVLAEIREIYTAFEERRHGVVAIGIKRIA